MRSEHIFSAASFFGFAIKYIKIIIYFYLIKYKYKDKYDNNDD